MPDGLSPPNAPSSPSTSSASAQPAVAYSWDDVMGSPASGIDTDSTKLLPGSMSWDDAMQPMTTAIGHAAAQGLIGGAGSALAGIAESFRGAEHRSAQSVLGAADKIDAGDTSPSIYAGMSWADRAQTTAYMHSSPAQRATMRAQLSQEGAKPGSVENAGRAVQQYGESFKVEPSNEGVLTGGTRMLAGLVPTVAAGAAGAVAGGPVGAVAGPAAIIWGQSYDAAHADATKDGLAPEAADKYATESAIGQVATMSVPMGRLLGALPAPVRDGAVKTIVNLGKHGIEFGSFNALSQFVQNYARKQSIDPNQSLLEGVPSAFGQGVVAGLVVPAVGAAARAVLPASRSAAAPSEAPPAATPTTSTLTPDAVLRRAEAQKAIDAQPIPGVPTPETHPVPSVAPAPTATGPNGPQIEREAQRQRLSDEELLGLPPVAEAPTAQAEVAPSETVAASIPEPVQEPGAATVETPGAVSWDEAMEAPAEQPPSGVSPYGAVPKEPERLSSFVKRLGGVQDKGGDIRSTLGGNRFRPGLVNKNGMPIDDMVLRAWEAGYFPDSGDQRPTINDFLDNLDNDLNRGQPQYAEGTAAAGEQYRAAVEHNNEIDRLASEYDVPIAGLTRDQFYDAVRAKMADTDAAHAETDQDAAYRDFENDAREEMGDGWNARNFYGTEQNRSQKDLDHENQAEAAARESQPSPRDEQSAAVAGPADEGEASLRPDRYNAGAARSEVARPATTLFGEPIAEPRARPSTEPTIRNDARQIGIPGTEPSAVQAQAARDQAGRGALQSDVEQRAADEGLFAPPQDTQDDIPFQMPTPLYSPVERAVDGLKQERGTGAQMLAQLRKAPGVKPEELEWTGLDDWLSNQKTVTRQQIADYLRENRVDIQEATPKPRWGEYVTPGGENYRELLLTHAPKPRPSRWVSTDQLPDNFHIIHKPTAPSDARWSVSTHPEGHGPSYAGYHATEEAARQAALDKYNGNVRKIVDAGLQDEAHRDQFRSSHWEEPNVLAHVRFDTRIAPDGKRVLMLHEVQSDLHQKGRREGYVDRKRPWEVFNIGDGSAVAAYPTHEEAARDAISRGPGFDYGDARHAKAPLSPFKTSWSALVLRRMIKYAVDHGYDRVAWSPGQVHADRYDLSKRAEAVRVNLNQDGTYQIGVKPNGQNMQRHSESVAASKLDETVGKDLADKIRAQVTSPGVEHGKTFSGLDLKVGGEGMRGFYDRILPAEANKIIGKFGEKVGESAVGEGLRDRDIIAPDERAQDDHRQEWNVLSDRIQELYDRRMNAVDAEGQPDHDARIRAGREAADLEVDRDNLHADMVNETIARSPNNVGAVHSFDITPAMREAVTQHGMPLFQREPTSRTPSDAMLEKTPELARGIDRLIARTAPGAKAEQTELPHGAHGAYFTRTGPDGTAHIIAWSLASPDVLHTVSHETMHYLRRAGFLRPAEWNALADASDRQGWQGRYDIARRYSGLNEDRRTEEAVAERFADWTRGLRSNLPGAIGRIFTRLALFRQQVAALARRMLGKDATPEDVFARIQSGEVGHRTPDASTTLAPAYQLDAQKKEQDRRAIAGIASKAPIRGGAGFLKKRTFETQAEGMAARTSGLGLPPEKQPGLAARVVDEIKAVFAPTSRGPQAKGTEMIIRRRASMLARAKNQTGLALDHLARQIDKLPETEQLAITDRAEHGEPETNPTVAKAMDALRQQQDAWLKRIQSLGRGYLEEARENYMGHIWSNYREWKAGVDQNLKPVTTNPIRLQTLKLMEMQKFYHGTRMADELKAGGIAQWVPYDQEGGARTAGLVKLNDPVFQPRLTSEGEYGVREVGGWYAPEPAARVFNNYVSRGLAGQSSIYDAIRRSNNALNSTQLSFSGFHATFVLNDILASRLALGLEQTSRGDFGRGVANAATAFSPTTWLKTYQLGRKLGQAWLDPASASPEMRRLARMFETGGGRLRMDEFYQSGASGTFFHSLHDMSDMSGVWHEAKAMVRDTPLSAPFKLAGRLTDTLNQPLMGHLVPTMKRGVWSMMAADWLRRNPDASPEEAARAMTDAWDSVENRMGEMTYDNLFWNKTMKDIAFVSTRSVGWNLGTVRELGGGVVDLASQLAQGKVPQMTHRMAYTIAMPMMTATMGALVTYLLNGHGPRQMLDYFYPPTGVGDNRVSLPGYMKDVIAAHQAPLQTALNKTSPLLETAKEIVTNRDYYGASIYDPTYDKPWIAYPEFLLNQAIPFSMRAWMKDRQSGADMLTQALSFWGIQPAPQSIVHPENEAAWQAREGKQAYKRRLRENAKGQRIQFGASNP